VQQCNNSGSVDTMQRAIEHIKKAGIKTGGIGAELAFIPADAGKVLHDAFPQSKIGDALFALERLRSIKTPDELKKLKIASEAVIDSMKAVIAGHKPGATTAQLTEALRRQETDRGLTFDYCLITAGTSLNRAPSDRVWGEGDIMSLDSGGNYHGYIGDLCRMAIQGEPDAELVDMLGDIEEIQRAAMKPIKAGAMGSEVYTSAEARLKQSKHHNSMHFLGHGMGLVSHEAPRLTNSGPVPYDDYDAHRPLEAGMVISVETTMQHPKRGFIKLEDTVIVTGNGFDIYGEGARGWNRGGTAA
jgi:Xaa-Pro aminopeptidase